MNIRPCEAGDLPRICNIYNDIIATTTAVYRDDPVPVSERREWFEARTAAGFPVLVAEGEAGVTGFASFGAFRAAPCYRHTVEITVHVDRDVRGQGVGGQLIGALVREAEERSLHVLMAGVDASNEGSIRLHERLGFVRVAHLREVGFKFGRWLDLVLLERILGDA